MTLDETLQQITAEPTVAAACTALLAAITTAMRDVEAMSEWTELADQLDAHAPDVAAAVAAAGQTPPAS
jgi:hypothetical protein